MLPPTWLAGTPSPFPPQICLEISRTLQGHLQMPSSDEEEKAKCVAKVPLMIPLAVFDMG